MTESTSSSTDELRRTDRPTILLVDPFPKAKIAQMNVETHLEWFRQAIGEDVDINLVRIDPSENELSSVLLQDVDGVIVAGSPHSVDEHEKYPWITNLQDFIRDAVQAQVPLLTVCFGHQSAAVALGGTVETKEPEYGMTTIDLTLAGKQSPLFLDVPKQFAAANTHSDFVTALPEGAVPLAHSASGVQAWTLPYTNVYGLQFHGEMPPRALGGMITTNREAILQAGKIHVGEERPITEMNFDDQVEAVQWLAEQHVQTGQRVIRNFVRLCVLPHHQDRMTADSAPSCMRSIQPDFASQRPDDHEKRQEMLQALNAQLADHICKALLEEERWTALVQLKLVDASDRDDIPGIIRRDVDEWLQSEDDLPSPAVSRWLLYSGIVRVNLDPDWSVGRQKYLPIGLDGDTGSLEQLIAERYGAEDPLLVLHAGSGNNSIVHESNQTSANAHFGIGNKLYVSLYDVLREHMNVDTYSEKATEHILKIITTALQIKLQAAEGQLSQRSSCCIQDLNDVFPYLQDLRALLLDTGVIRTAKLSAWSKDFPCIMVSDEFTFDNPAQGLRVDRDNKVCCEVLDWLEGALGCEADALKAVFLRTEEVFLTDEERIIQCITELISQCADDSLKEVRPAAEDYLYLMTGCTVGDMADEQKRETVQQKLQQRQKEIYQAKRELGGLHSECITDESAVVDVLNRLTIPDLPIPATEAEPGYAITPLGQRTDHRAYNTETIYRYDTQQALLEGEHGVGIYGIYVRMFRGKCPGFDFETILKKPGDTAVALERVFSNDIAGVAQGSFPIDLNERLVCYPRHFALMDFGEMATLLPHGSFDVITSMRADSHAPHAAFYAILEQYLLLLREGGVVWTDGRKRSYTREERLAPSGDGFQSSLLMNTSARRPVSLLLQRQHPEGYLDSPSLVDVSRKFTGIMTPERYIAERSDRLLIDDVRRRLVEINGTHTFYAHMHDAFEFLIYSLLSKWVVSHRFQEMLERVDVGYLSQRICTAVEGAVSASVSADELRDKTFFELAHLLMSAHGLDTEDLIARRKFETALQTIILESLYADSQSPGFQPRELDCAEELQLHDELMEAAFAGLHDFTSDFDQRVCRHMFERFLLTYRLWNEQFG